MSIMHTIKCSVQCPVKKHVPSEFHLLPDTHKLFNIRTSRGRALTCCQYMHGIQLAGGTTTVVVAYLHVCWQAQVFIEAGDGGAQPHLNFL